MSKHLGSHRGHSSQGIREKYWMPLEEKHKAGAWEVLDAAYSEPHRAYHTWEHIGDMLEKLSAFSGSSARRDIIAISTFWHDVVYKTKNDDGSLRPDADNVRDSAGLFGAARDVVGIRRGAISGNMKVSCQAARSIG
jgi:predicted metal-dependent HD superfamily phosphohydrolase